jgi:hypothetical protein
MTTAERQRETFDMSKTRDWLTRDIVFGYGSPRRRGRYQLRATTL